MAFYDVPLTPTRPDGADVEAPSSVVNAARGLARWQFALSLVGVTLIFTAPWFLLSLTEFNRLARAAGGEPGGWFADAQQNRILSAAAGGLAFLNALVMARCGFALRLAGETRLVSDLHRALRRLRTVWRTVSLTLLLVTAAALTAIYAGDLFLPW